MKAIINSLKRIHLFKASAALFTYLLFMTLPSCQKDELKPVAAPDIDGLSSSALSKKTKISYGKLKDVEGNIYKTVKIGKQWWMAENLKTTRYNNGDLIGSTTPATLDITEENRPKYQWVFNEDESNLATYGRLYTWYAVTDSRNVCPKGWHVSTDTEWTTLENYLIAHGYNYDGTTTGNKIAKSMAATNTWSPTDSPGTPGTDLSSNNSSGFTALPGGRRESNGLFLYIEGDASWWSSTGLAQDTPDAWCWLLYCGASYLHRGSSSKPAAFSVRCVKGK